jgi:hypothetical protein
MRHLKIILILAVVILSVTACNINSLYPLFSEDEPTVKVDGLLGEYSDDEVSFKFTLVDTLSIKTSKNKMFPDYRSKEESAFYAIDIEHKGEEVIYSGRVGKINDDYYINLLPKKYEIKNGFLNINLTPMNTFAKLDVYKDSIRLSFIDFEWFGKAIEKSKVRLKYREINDVVLLLSETKDLKRFVAKYGDEAFTEDMVLYRKKRDKNEKENN